jgi:hypothetical protein
VVSEETGDLSMAAFGEIHRGLSLREVDERVNAHFGVGKLGASSAGSFVPQPEEGAKTVERAG